MSISVVRLGEPRHEGEGLRIGTVRRPPRGVPKNRFAQDDWYDVWLPELAPSAELVREGLSAKSESEWSSFTRKYRRELSAPSLTRLLELLAMMSRQTDFSVGCYCEDEKRCHRSVLRELLAEAGATMKRDALE